MHPHLQSCHWLVRTNQRTPCCLPAVYQFGQDDIKFLVLCVKDHMKTDVLITASSHCLKNEKHRTFHRSEWFKANPITILFPQFGLSLVLGSFLKMSYKNKWSRGCLFVNIAKRGQNANLTMIQSTHGGSKQWHVRARCCACMRPCEIQHDKSNFIEWDRSLLVWLT